MPEFALKQYFKSFVLMRMFIKGFRFKVSYKFNIMNLVCLQLLHFYRGEKLNRFRDNCLALEIMEIN